MQLRVASWNLHGCVGADGRYDPERIAEVLGSLEADVIGLQELDWRRAAVGADPLTLLAERLGAEAVRGPNLRDERGEYGNGLLTRLAVEGVRRVPLARGRREPRGALDVDLRWGRRGLRVLVTHLGLGRLERLAQARVLRAALADEHAGAARDRPTVLVGDLNEWLPIGWGGGLLVPRPFPVATALATFPARFPLLPLDRVLVRPAPARFEARVVRTASARRASDHLPLVVDLEWSDGGA